MPKGKFSFKGNSAAARAYAPGQIRKAAGGADVSASVTRKAVAPVARQGNAGSSFDAMRARPGASPAVTPAVRAQRVGADGVAGVGVRRGPSVPRPAADVAVGPAVQPRQGVVSVTSSRPRPAAVEQQKRSATNSRTRKK